MGKMHSKYSYTALRINTTVVTPYVTVRVLVHYNDSSTKWL